MLAVHISSFAFDDIETSSICESNIKLLISIPKQAAQLCPKA